jgi:hypothetical protein
MDSWWQLGEHSGHRGEELALYQIACPFCSQTNTLKLSQHVHKERASDKKRLNYDIYLCENCGNYCMVFWSSGDRLHDYRVLPWSLKLVKFPDHWPADVGRYWLQARRTLASGDYDASVIVARSALQLALRTKGARGLNLRSEISDLAANGELPKIMEEWSSEVRELGNDATHPKPGGAGVTAADATALVRFLDTLLEYLFTIPHQIEQYRNRKTPA